jgi:hypothetical protein
MHPHAIRPAGPSLRRLCELLVLFASLRRISDPIPGDLALRYVIDVVVSLAGLAGIEPPCADHLPSLPPNPTVLRVVQNVLNPVATDNPAPCVALPMPATQEVALWLPMANYVISLARRPDT